MTTTTTTTTTTPAATALLIDPYARIVKEVPFPVGLKQMYEVIHCSLVDCVRLPASGPLPKDRGNDAVFVDDEGLLKEGLPVFKLWNVNYEKGYVLLAGRGLLIGVDSEGNSVPPLASLAELKSAVTFTNYVTTGRV